jgi:hypothetical protein
MTSIHLSQLPTTSALPAQPAAPQALPEGGIAAFKAALLGPESVVSFYSAVAPQRRESVAGISSVATEMLNLSSSLGSGNLDSARAAYDSFRHMLGSPDQAADLLSNGLAASPLLQNLLSQVEISLRTGSLNEAQSALDLFMEGLAGGQVVNTSGWMPTVPGKLERPPSRRFASMKRFNSSWLIRLLADKQRCLP